MGIESKTQKSHCSLNCLTKVPPTKTSYSRFVTLDIRCLDSYVLGNIREKFTLGAGLRGFSPNTLDGLMTMAGVQIAENISFYYTYTIPLSTLRTATTGSHEVMVRYTINQKLGKGILPPIIYNPRNL